MKLNCLILDDEPLALDVIERYVLQTTFLNLEARCSNAVTALETFRNKRIDLAFLDIQMPEMTGMELSRLIAQDVKIIFTTAFADYALEGFKVNALDYLLKPISYEEFYRAANKALDWQKLQSGVGLSGDEEFFFVRSEYRQVKIFVSDILLIEGLKDYVKIHLKSTSKPILTILSLKSIEERLSADRFMRIHRSFIVALDQIDSVERSQVIVGDSRITVADQYREKFSAFIAGKSFR